MREKGLPLPAATEPSGLERAFREHWTPLVRLAWLMTSSRNDAEDVVQAAFLRFTVVRPIPDVPGAYLRRMVVNGVHDLFRRRAVERRLTPGPDHVALDPDLREIWDAVQRLRPPHREVIVLRYYADLSAEEIATLLGCPLGTVRSRLARALSSLREVCRE